MMVTTLPRVPSQRGLFRGLAAWSLLGVMTSLLQAQVPSLSILSRRAAVPGQTAPLTLKGSGLSETTLSTTFSASVPLAADVADNSDTSATYSLTVPAETTPGFHAFRVVRPTGLSVLVPFLIDDLPVVDRQPGNQSPAKAQPLTIPAAVGGSIENLTRDYYRFAAKAGQTVSFEVFARRLGSVMDASLYLYDARGRILAYCDDTEGLSSDPQFAYRFAVDGDYTIEVRDIRYAGGNGHFYHLRIGDFPCVNSTWPLAVKRGARTTVSLAGIHASEAAPVTVNVPADWPHSWFPVSSKQPGGASSAFAMALVADQDDILDHEPNDQREQAQAITLGPGISGRFEVSGDKDNFKFTASKGARWRFAGRTRDLGLPTDLTFRMLKPDGSVLGTADDAGPAEGVLDVTFPEDGEYTLEVTDLNRRGNGAMVYRIEPSAYRPDFTIAAAADVVNAPAGGTASLVITSARRDYGGTIQLEFQGLPEGVVAPVQYIGPGVNQVTTTLTLPKDFQTKDITTLRVVGKAFINGATYQTVATVTNHLRASWNGLTSIPPRYDEMLALGGTPAQGVQLRIEPAQIELAPGLKTTIKVHADRGEGFDEAITLAGLPEKEGIPPNLEVQFKPIDKGQTTTELVLVSNEKFSRGSFTLTLLGTHKKDKATTNIVVPSLAIRVTDAFKMTLEPAAPIALPKGGNAVLKVKVERHPVYNGEVKLTCEKLPAGVSAAEVVLKPDQTEAEITLTAAADAAPVMVGDVLLRASSPADAKVTNTIGLPSLTVQAP